MDNQNNIFGTDGIRGTVGVYPMTADMMLHVGWALGSALKNHVFPTVLIGKDTRISGYMIESALQAGLSASGANIKLLGPMPTSAIAYLTRALRAQAGIVISASHNPYYDNGVKFFSPDGFKFNGEFENKLKFFLNKKIVTKDSKLLGKAKRVDDAAGRYIEFCKSTVPHHTYFSGLKIVVDCANGATYHIAPHVFSELGAHVITIHDQPDGININKKCGTNSPESLARHVVKTRSDLGIAFDGDGDRVVMVDHRGEILNGDELIYILAKNEKKLNILTGGVVVTTMSNMGLLAALKKEKIDVMEVPVGEHHVIAGLLEKKWRLGAESSGHITDLNLTTTHDGIIAALQILWMIQKRDKNLHELKQGWEKYPQTLLNIPHQGKILDLQTGDIAKAVKAAKKELGSTGKLLLRYSGTEPYIRLLVESKYESKMNKLVDSLSNIIKNNL